MYFFKAFPHSYPLIVAIAFKAFTKHSPHSLFGWSITVIAKRWCCFDVQLSSQATPFYAVCAPGRSCLWYSKISRHHFANDGLSDWCHFALCAVFAFFLQDFVLLKMCEFAMLANINVKMLGNEKEMLENVDVQEKYMFIFFFCFVWVAGRKALASLEWRWFCVWMGEDVNLVEKCWTFIRIFLYQFLWIFYKAISVKIWFFLNFSVIRYFKIWWIWKKIVKQNI